MPRTPTREQRVIIEEKSGLFSVAACPGSGKTFTVAARLHRLLSGWRHEHRGIAVASFTNVAWKEIAGYLATEFNVHSPPHPHFLGTLDSFLNTYVFLPFGHLVMPSSARPVLTGPPHDHHEPIGSWMHWRNAECNKRGCKLNEFTYDLENNVVRIGFPKMGYRCTVDGRPCTVRKPEFTKHGRATQSDAVFFSLQVLQKYPVVAQALAHRFPVVIVDEAQDTSVMQMAILDLLIEHGLRELMLVGDPDQAIYEWREAEPSVFLAKSAAWQANSSYLHENWRSSQRLCNATSRMASSAEPMKAVNPDVASLELEAQIVSYREVSAISQIVEEFLRSCGEAGISVTERHALTRGKDLVNVIAPGTLPDRVDPWADSAPNTRPLAHAKYLYDKGQFAGAMRILERAFVARDGQGGAVDIARLYPSFTELRTRGRLLTLLDNLPLTVDTSIGKWVALAIRVLQQMPSSPVALPLGVKRKSEKCDYPNLSFDRLFGEPVATTAHPGIIAQTVHMAKGTSLDAVLVVLKKKGSSGPNYAKLIGNNVALCQSEELRIVYVALTRAKRVLWLAVPDGDEKVWSAYLGLQGFRGEYTRADRDVLK